MKLLPDIYGHDWMDSGKSPSDLPIVAPGIRALVVTLGPRVYIPLIEAITEGNGDCGRFLDSQPLGTTWCIPNVVNFKLEQMLARRGFKIQYEQDTYYGEHVEVWTRTR